MSVSDLVATVVQQQQQISGLIDAIKLMPGVNAPVQVTVQAPVDGAEVVRARKIQNLAINLRKSNRIKPFKVNDAADIRKYIKKFEEELRSLKPMVGIEDELTQAEYVPLFRSSIEYDVIVRVEQVFLKDPANVQTWQAISIVDLHKLMISEFGVQYTDVATVLNAFGPSRLQKSADKTVAEFYFEWCQNIPEIMKPTSNEDCKKFADLILRSIFYISLDDLYLQQALSDLKDPDPTLKSYFDEAIAAESRRKSFQDITTTSSNLDSKGGVSLSKWDASFKQKKYHKDKGKAKQADKQNEPAKQNQNTKPQKQNEPVKQTQNSDNSKPKKYCTHCVSETHWTKYCWKLNKNKKKQINNLDVSSANHSDNQPGQGGDFGTFHCFEAVDHKLPVVDSFATKLATHPLATNQSLMTKLNLENVMNLKMEVDTAASHNIISKNCFEDLQIALLKHGKEKSKKLSRGVKIRLADGSMAEQECQVVQIFVSTELSKFTDPKPLTFLVVNGPNNLVGRYSLELLFPTEFNAFKDATCQNMSENTNCDSIKPNCKSQNICKTQTKSKKESKSNSKFKKTKELGNSVSAPICPAQIRPRTEAGPQHLNSPPPSFSQTPPRAAQPVQSGSADAGKSNDVTQQQQQPWPDRRPLPPMPEGIITKEIGQAHLKKIFAVYSEVFDGKKGTFRGAEATMVLKPGGLEQIKKSGCRPVAKCPYGLEDQFDPLLDKLYEDLEIIDGKDLITASQIVPVIETKNGVRKLKRLAVNYKSTINPFLEDIPDVFTTCNDELAKCAGEYRTCVDLQGAYKQVVINDHFSRKILAVVTPRGYAIPNRLMFGVKTAPAIFNANMRKLMHSCNGKGPIRAAQMVDDVCLSGANPKEHFENVAEFLYRLYACGLKANLSKCTLYEDEVRFLGKVVDSRGVRLDTRTTDAILQMPAPIDKAQLRSFLGHISYVSKHIPDLRSARAPLDYLIKPDIKFVWNVDHETAFQKCKTLAGNPALLTHFDPSKPIVLTTDASPYGIGACLSHKSVVIVNNKTTTRLLPIAYASASLKDAQRNYAQIDREGLGVYWAINHFRQYLLCSDFELHTDCSALVKIFGPKNDMGGCAAGRLSRWAASLMEYSFSVKHIKGTNNNTADSLSRLPIVTKGTVSAPFPVIQDVSNMALPASIMKVDAEILFDVKNLAINPSLDILPFTINQLVGDSPVDAWDIVPLTVKEVADATRNCKIFGKLFRAIKTGKLDVKDKDISNFNGVFENLYIDNDVIHLGNRIVIPPRFHERLLTELHASHIGVVSMKRVIRDIFWWPGISKSIEHMAAKCDGCRKFKKKPPPNSLSVWPFARRPMERCHIDFFEYRGKHVLLMVDAYSKKIWTQLMNSDTTTGKTLAVLYNWFCSETGQPSTIVSDNGPQFTANIFKDKMKLWNIKHVLSPPYHPASNGAAERGVQLYKDRLKKMNVSARPVELYVALAYIGKVHGLTPHSSTDRMPYELIKKGNVPSLFPNLLSDVSKQSELTVTRHCTAKLRNRRNFSEGEHVVVYDNHKKLSYPAVVSEVRGSNNYTVFSDNGLKHVSGDVMSRTVKPATVATDDRVDRDIDVATLNDRDDLDTISVSSDLSEDFDEIEVPQGGTNHYNIVNHNRRGQREVASLGPAPPNLSRLRSGRLY